MENSSTGRDGYKDILWEGEGDIGKGQGWAGTEGTHKVGD